MFKILDEQNSIIGNMLAELRDAKIQTNRARFAQNLEGLGAILAYEVSKSLNFEVQSVKTPLGTKQVATLSDEVVLATILRAGLPVLKGMSNIFDKSEQAFVAASRIESGKDINISLNYVSSPKLNGKVLIIADTMLATGKSVVEAYQALQKEAGTPERLIVACVIASQPGVEYIQKNLPQAEIYTCSVDEELNDKKYIVPGLGDAGDLLFGHKL